MHAVYCKQCGKGNHRQGGGAFKKQKNILNQSFTNSLIDHETLLVHLYIVLFLFLSALSFITKQFHRSGLSLLSLSCCFQPDKKLDGHLLFDRLLGLQVKTMTKDIDYLSLYSPSLALQYQCHRVQNHACRVWIWPSFSVDLQIKCISVDLQVKISLWICRSNVFLLICRLKVFCGFAVFQVIADNV